MARLLQGQRRGGPGSRARIRTSVERTKTACPAWLDDPGLLRRKLYPQSRTDSGRVPAPQWRRLSPGLLPGCVISTRPPRPWQGSKGSNDSELGQVGRRLARRYCVSAYRHATVIAIARLARIQEGGRPYTMPMDRSVSGRGNPAPRLTRL